MIMKQMMLFVLPALVTPFLAHAYGNSADRIDLAKESAQSAPSQTAADPKALYAPMKETLFGTDGNPTGSVCNASLIVSAMHVVKAQETIEDKANSLISDAVFLFCKEMALVLDVEYVTADANEKLCAKGNLVHELQSLNARLEAIRNQSQPPLQIIGVAEKYSYMAKKIAPFACGKLNSQAE